MRLPQQPHQRFRAFLMFSAQEQTRHLHIVVISGSRVGCKSELALSSSALTTLTSVKYPLSTLQIAPQQQSRIPPHTPGRLRPQPPLFRFCLSAPMGDLRQLRFAEGSWLITAQLNTTTPQEQPRLTT